MQSDSSSLISVVQISTSQNRMLAFLSIKPDHILMVYYRPKTRCATRSTIIFGIGSFSPIKLYKKQLGKRSTTVMSSSHMHGQCIALGQPQCICLPPTCRSSVVEKSLLHAWASGKRFSVIVVDSRPMLEGTPSLHLLFGISFMYCLSQARRCCDLSRAHRFRVLTFSCPPFRRSYRTRQRCLSVRTLCMRMAPSFRGREQRWLP